MTTAAKSASGNFLGDFVRKSEEIAYEDTIRQEYICIEIDLYGFASDILISRRRVSDLNRLCRSFRICSMIALAKNWQGYSGIHLENMCTVFMKFKQDITILPGKLKRIMPYLTEEKF